MRRRPFAVLAAGLALTGCFATPEAEQAPDVVEVFGPYRDEEADRIGELLERFTETTGIQTRYAGSSDFVNDLRIRLGEGATPPDVAFIPQPGIVEQLVGDGSVVEPSTEVTDALAENFGDRARLLGAVDLRSWGVPFRLSVKSLVWYRPEVFAEHEWQVPASLSELHELSGRIVVESDIAPWCMTLRSGGATGWPATDWVEDLVVRRQGATVYTAWKNGAVAFDSDAIRSSFDEFSSLVLAPGWLAGGPPVAVETPADDVFAGLFSDPPRCAMVKQADFATSWLPEGTTIGPDADVDVFILPGDGEDGAAVPPLVVGTDVAVALSARPDVDRLLQFLANATSGAEWVADGGFISPKSSISLDVYPEGFERELARAVRATDDLLIDASDAMPPSVGTSTYWENITRWVAGAASYDEVAEILDAAFAEALGVDETDAVDE